MEIKRLNRTEITDLNIEGHDIIVEELHHPMSNSYESGTWYAYFDGKRAFGSQGNSINEALLKLAYGFSGETVVFDDGYEFKFPALKHTKIIE